jgi:hypothetical protein
MCTESRLINDLTDGRARLNLAWILSTVCLQQLHSFSTHIRLQYLCVTKSACKQFVQNSKAWFGRMMPREGKGFAATLTNSRTNIPGSCAYASRNSGHNEENNLCHWIVWELEFLSSGLPYSCIGRIFTLSWKDVIKSQLHSEVLVRLGMNIRLALFVSGIPR